jgi:hypothetical protein
MKNISIPVFLLISFFLVQPISAQIQNGDGATIIVNDLLDKGIHSVGEMDLENLSKELKVLKWEVASDLPPEEIAWGRRSAYYLKDEKKIVVSQRPGQFPKGVVLQQLELHEALGALGYRDHNYSQTSALIILNQLTNENQRKQLVDSFGKTIFSKGNLKAAKGGSSVGGGGDSAALIVKMAVLNQILKNYPHVQLEFYSCFAEINFEPAPEPYIGAEYHLAKGAITIRGAPKNKEFSELLTITFPKEKMDSQVIHQMSEIIIGLVPTYSKVKSHVVKIKGCKNQSGVIYPATDNFNLLTLQMMRASFLLNCDNDVDTHMYVSFRD